MPSVQTISGSGSFKDATLISFSYSEDASPDNPADLNGGTGQVNVQVVEEAGSRGSLIAINNEVQLSDEIFGEVSFKVRQVSVNQGLVTLVGETVESLLDQDVTAPPYGSPSGGYTLYTAIVDYCGLVGVTPNFEAGLEERLDTINVDFIGWRGNLWEHLKMLCAAWPIDVDNNTLLEMYIKDNELWFREGLVSEVDLSDRTSSSSITINSHDAAQSFTMARYITDYRSDALVRQEGAQNAGFANLENVSITDSMQVNALEKLVRRVRINASLEQVNTPVPVYSISTVPYTGVTGEYVIIGKDGLPLTPEQWLGQGGSLTVGLTENPNEIEITIVGANYPELEPFRIGVESSGSESYPALYITGTGVFFERVEEDILTGAPSDSEATAPTIDNPFMTNENVFWTRGVAAAQHICGPSFQLNQQINDGLEFGNGLGKMVYDTGNKFRINRLTYSQSGISLTGKKYTTFADFNETWSGSTISDFNQSMSGLSFNEFTIVPLSKDGQ